MIGLTRRQRQVLEFLQSSAVVGESPSIEEIGANVGLGKSGVFRVLTALAERGVIRRMAHRARAIEIIKQSAPLGTGVFVRSSDHPKLAAYCQRTGRLASAVVADAVNFWVEHLNDMEAESAAPSFDKLPTEP